MRTIISYILLLLLLTVPTMITAQEIGDMFSGKKSKFNINAEFETNTSWRHKQRYRGEKILEGDVSENYRARVNLAAPICTIKGVRIGVAFTYSMSHIDFAADTPFNTTYGSASKLDHHVFSPTLNAGYIFRIGQLPIITNIGIRSDFSQYGYARTSGTVMAFAPLKKNDNSFLALGLFGMLNTTLITPCLPMVIYNYKFNDRFGLSRNLLWVSK